MSQQYIYSNTLTSFQNDIVYFKNCDQIHLKYPYLKPVGSKKFKNYVFKNNTNNLQQLEYGFSVNLVLLKQKEIHTYFHYNFLQYLQIPENKYFISEIWIYETKHMYPCILFIPKDCKDVINEYNIYLSQQNIESKYLLTKNFFYTCPILQQDEFVTKMSSSILDSILIVTNLNHLFKIFIRNDSQSFDCIPLQFDYPISDIQLYTGGSFHIVTCQNNITNEINVYGIGDNYYCVFGEKTDLNSFKNSLFKITKLPKNQLLQKDDFFSCSWDNTFLVKNNGKELYGCGRNYGSFFTNNHRGIENFTMVDLSNLLFENEKIVKVHGTDEKVIILLNSGDVLVNRYTFSIDKSIVSGSSSVIIGKTFVRLKCINFFKGQLVIDAVTTRDHFVCLLKDLKIVRFTKASNSGLNNFESFNLNLENQLEKSLENYELKLFGYEFNWSLVIKTLQGVYNNEYNLLRIEGLKDIDFKFN
ncbi:hypothetical protein ABK040_005295 [Willaertia magna]